MTSEGGEKAVVISAAVVFGIYFYRHLTEGTSTVDNGVPQLIGFGTPANVGRFVTAWGFLFLLLAIVNEAAPGLGGSFAILVAVADALANGAQVSKDVSTKLGQSQSTSPVTSGAPITPAPGNTAGTLAASNATLAQQAHQIQQQTQHGAGLAGFAGGGSGAQIGGVLGNIFGGSG